jgi:hypothetical protein
MKIKATRDSDGEPAITLSEVFSGIGIETDMGLFGIAQRDGGIEVMLDGKTVWTSHELEAERARVAKQWEAYCPADVPRYTAKVELGPGCEPLSPNGPGVRLPDGSGAFVASYPLPKTHWIYADHENVPPAFMRMGIGQERTELALQIASAARYAIRASTMNGKEMDFDPDAMVQNMVVGLLGYWTEDGRSGSRGEVESGGE